MLVVAMGLCSVGAFSQSISYVPTRFSAYISSDGSGNPGTWQPLTGSGGTAISFVPQPIAVYYSTDGTGNPGTWAPWNGSSSGGGDTITSPNSTITVGGTAAATTLDINLAKSLVWTASGALSTPAVLYNGTPVTSGGTGTSTWPLVLIQPAATTSTIWNTAGTMFGANAPSGFTGNLFDFQTNGASFLHLGATGSLVGNLATFATYSTGTVCASAASPAVCSGSAAGSVVIAASATSVVVDTTRVTANSQILIQDDSSLSTRLAVTCNTALAPPQVTARTAGTSFTISTAVAPTANPACYSYTITN
jgi:hypothetical protein